MSYYQHHLFFCTNQRENGESCCQQHGAQAMRDYLKDRAKAVGLQNVRINSAGCLGRCDDGPVIVVYPEGTWYTYIDESDLDDILSEHLQNGRVVERLKV